MDPLVVLATLNKIRNDDVAACLMIFMTSRLLSAYDYFYAVEAKKKSILAKMTVYYQGLIYYISI